LFSGNSSTTHGGALAFRNGSDAVVANTTIGSNSAAGDGGGVFAVVGSNPTLLNSIFWGNSDASGVDETAQITNFGGTTSVNYSCVQGWTGALGGMGNIGADPFFIDVDGDDNDVGTSDDNLRLWLGSPCIDAADNMSIPPDTTDLDRDMDTTETIPFDLDGNPRIVADVVDMGAYEYQSTCGNGDCETGENSCNCPGDCGSPPASEVPGSTCLDDIDNDCDALVDCDDPDCEPCCGDGDCDPGEDSCNCLVDCGVPPSTEVPGSTCADGVDNDCDGNADCNDPDCDLDPSCQGCGDGGCGPGENPCNCEPDCGPMVSEEPGLTCQDGVDNDCDSLIDCDDSDCSSDPACQVCGDGTCGAGESCTCPADCGTPAAQEYQGATCDDGEDNDCDSLIDCDDSDCVADPFCAPSTVYVHHGAAPGGDGTSWDTAFNDLQDALADAFPGDEIWVAQGTYTPTGPGGDRAATFQLLNEVTIKGGYAGPGAPDPDDRNIAAYETILSGDVNGDDPSGVCSLPLSNCCFAHGAPGCDDTDCEEFVCMFEPNCCLVEWDSDCADLAATYFGPLCLDDAYCENSYHVLIGSGTDSTAMIEGFKITAGYASGPGSGDHGGGIYTESGSPTISNCIFTENRSASTGGGMHIEGSPILYDCVVTGNSAPNHGGGMYIGGSGSPTLVDCTFRNNSTDERGGGIYAQTGGVLTLTNCMFGNNSAESGGGMANCGSNSHPKLTNCVFSRNTVTGDSPTSGGGGLYNTNGGAPVIAGCIFTGNSTQSGGGGMYNLGGAPSLTNCIFSGNEANEGGGLYNRNNGNAILINCTFTGNWATVAGGGLHSYDSSPTLINCVLWDDIAPNGHEISIPQHGTLTVAYCDVQRGQVGIPLGEEGILLWNEGNIDVDPLLTPDGHLATGSPCIDAGNNAAVPPDISDLDGDGDTTEPIPFDCDSDSRFVDDPNVADTGDGTPPIVDMGADEYVDTDGDSLPNTWEQGVGLDPDLPDSDGDTIPDGDEDIDSDGLTNLDEYERYGSNPLAAPYYVDGVNGDDAFDGRAPTPQGGGVGPKQTIQAGLNIADWGDTVLVALGTYAGTGNTDLNYNAKSVVVLAPDGPTMTTIDCQGSGRAVNADSIQGTFAVLEGFTITGGNADFGGGILVTQSRLMLKDCVLAGNSATAEGGGIHADFTSLTINDLTIGVNSAPTETADAGTIANSNVNLQSVLVVTEGTLAMRSSWFYGPGSINLAQGTMLHVTGGAPGDLRTVIRSNISGTGDIAIDLGQELRVENGSIVDLSGYTGSGCANPEESENWGTITVDGVLYARDATIQNTNVEVTLADFAGDIGMINNDITLLEASDGYGGEFFVEGAAFIRCNIITSHGDRYLDLDPDPSIPPEQRPTLEENRINVIITQGVGDERGEILELRAQDFDCTTNGANPTCESGSYPAPGSPGFTADPSENWVLESLEILPGAKLNLTNRQGLVFQDPGISTPETVYVKDLVLRENATLNTALQALYYETLTMEAGSEIVDVPLLGFSLKIIAMEDDNEFAVRIRKRLRDPADQQPQDPPFMKGSITREESLDVSDPTNGLMDIRTQAVGQLSASSVAAKGAFARASDEEVVVAFDYLFVNNPAAELIVYLSDDPEASESLVELVRISPPAYGPGSIGSNEWALFYGTFPKGQLNFTRGTYVELELRGTDSRVWIDNFDPQIRCPSQCGDFAPPDGLDTEDFLVLLGELGRTLDPFDADADKWCLDSKISFDQYIDLSDIFTWDTFLNGAGLNACGSGFGGGRSSGSQPRTGTPVTLPSTDALVIAGKPNGSANQRDCLYTTDPAGACLGNPLDPASAPDPVEGFRSNGRLVQDGQGNVYQVHGTQGLVRLDTGAVVIPPSGFTVGDAEIYVGVTSVGDDDFNGVPLLDVAFNPTDNTIAYVVPVLVVPEDTDPDQAICPYKAAAKLQLNEQPDGTYTTSLLDIYGTDPAQDDCVTVDPLAGCEFVLREPDVQRGREIEIDASGQNVFVLSAQALGTNNDWLLVFDEASGAELRISAGGTFPQPAAPSCAPTGAGVPLPASPTAMALSACGDQLYLASSLANQDPSDVRTEVSVFDTQLNGGGGVTGLTLNRVIDIDNNGAIGPDYGWGHMATVTAIAERLGTCELYVTGLTAPRVDPYLSTTDPLYGQLFGTGSPIFTTPTLAIIPAGQTTAIASELDCHDLILPISAVFNVAAGVPGDCDGDGDVDLDDHADFVDCILGPAADLGSDCDCFDLEPNGHVDLGDYATFQVNFTGG